MKQILSPNQIAILKDKMSKEALFLKLFGDLLEIHNKFLSKVDELDTIVNKKVGPVGPKGDRGSNGQKGDMPSTQDIISIVEKYIPKVKDGKDGRDGETPIKGVHYFTKREIEQIAKIASTMVRSPKNGKDAEIDGEKLLHLFTNLPEGKKLSTKHIDGLEQTLNAFKNQLGRGYLHGGGDTVGAGSGVTITIVNGTKIISATGSSGTSVIGEVVSFSGTSGTLANTPQAGTLRLFRGGSRQQSGAGNDYTLAVATITLAQAALTGEIFLADYTY